VQRGQNVENNNIFKLKKANIYYKKKEANINFKN